MHAQFAGGAALVAFVFREHGQDEALLELAHGFGIKNVAVMHLQDEGFELVFHKGYLSIEVSRARSFCNSFFEQVSLGRCVLVSLQRSSLKLCYRIGALTEARANVVWR